MSASLPEKADVLIIGGGPAGLMAGWAAAQKNHNVVIVEAKSHIGENCHCAEWVPKLLKLEVEIPSNCVRAKAESLNMKAGKRKSEARVAGLVLERKIWEKHLAAKAVESGAKLISGTKFTGLNNSVAEINGYFGTAHIDAKVIIGADGALSRLASSLGLIRLKGVNALQIEVDLKDINMCSQVEFNPELLGYMWLFPKGKTANLGLGGKTYNNARLADLLDRWWAKAQKNNWVGSSIFRRSGGFIPVSGIREEAGFLNESNKEQKAILFAGDAAGLAHPMTGAGIPQAIISGKMAGKAADEYLRGSKTAVDEYCREIKSTYGGYINRGITARKKAEKLWPDDLGAAVEKTWPLWPKQK